MTAFSRLWVGKFFGILCEKIHNLVAPGYFPRAQKMKQSLLLLVAEPVFDLAVYYPIFLYLIVIVGFALVSLALAHLVGPRKATAVKLMPYESGMDPIGEAHQRFDVRFYLIAIIFLVFDVELLFLYPWAVAFYRQPGVIPVEIRGPVFWEIIVFLATLALAYVYAWRKGVFEWR
jgi:NADH-quinone oxidoreductase subunit A